MLSQTMRHKQIGGNSRDANVKVKAYSKVKNNNFLKIALLLLLLLVFSDMVICIFDDDNNNNNVTTLQSWCFKIDLCQWELSEIRIKNAFELVSFPRDYLIRIN